MEIALDKQSAGSAEPIDTNVVRRLVASAFLMLFLELVLIRWLGANVVHLSYFSNFVLLGSFLGIGAGFLISRKSWSIWPWSLPLLTVLIFAVSIVPLEVERAGDEIIYFTALDMSGPPAWVVLPLVFLATAAVLAGPAEQVGRCFAKLPPLIAYRYDLIGSLAGIIAFGVLSFLHAPSMVWGLIVFPLYWVLYEPEKRRPILIGMMLGMLAVLGGKSLRPEVRWSPYYKIVTQASPTDEDVYGIAANGVPHQVIGSTEWKLAQGEGIYEMPYQRLPENSLQDVLIIGAGSGSDVAIALKEGAQNIDAVDIDPQIMQIGRELNPDQPYSDPRVVEHVNDGRAFLEASDKKYDLILFALPDSLTLVSGASQIRLESFLFTEEAMAAVRERLKPDGGFAMYNYYREGWLIDRLARTAEGAFGHAPCIDTHAKMQAVITIAAQPSDQQCDEVWNVENADPASVASSDDAPFLYFKGDSFPQIYLITIIGIVLLTFATVRVLGGPLAPMRPYADLFFMGVAFLLLQTRSIATFALLFGTTWFVNAIVFAGVLLVVLLAVELTRRFKTPSLPVIYCAIVASLALSWFVPDAALLQLPAIPRAFAACGLAFLPIFLANVAFSKRFQQSGDSQAAFAINLLGAIVGGCLEYTALLLGYNNLLILVGAVYLLAFAFLPKEARPSAATA
ncbi:spermidine synthase [Erythrobacter sp. HA6-11]